MDWIPAILLFPIHLSPSIMRSLYSEYQSLLLPVARNLVKNEADAEDLVQETIVKWISLEKKGVENVKGYLVRTLINKCLNFLRDRKREERRPEIAPELLVDHPSSWTEVGPELSMSVLIMLEKLSPTERAVFLLKEIFGYSHKEIAEMLGISEENARQLLSRARRHLKDDRQRFVADPNRQTELYHRFVQVCRGGDMESLIEILREDIELETLAPAASLSGIGHTVSFIGDMMEQDAQWSVRILRGHPAVVYQLHDVLFVIRLIIEGEKIRKMILHPVRLPSQSPLTMVGRV
ncbi:MAG: sigma-70 family RNA polymerase sigma factor [Bacteroidia bacterium]|nr:sigma-70 family RNA polymerase sigma factor [Bacteroidia bacterium]